MAAQLSTRHKAFADSYLSNGFNAKQAYLSISPKVKENTAEVEGNKYLRKPKVEEYIQQQQTRLSEKKQITRESQIERLEDLLNDLDRCTNFFGNTEGLTADQIVKIKLAFKDLMQEENKLLGLYAPDKHINENHNYNLSEDEQKEIDALEDEFSSEEETSGT